MLLSGDIRHNKTKEARTFYGKLTGYIGIKYVVKFQVMHLNKR